jgi:hypothetical protein
MTEHGMSEAECNEVLKNMANSRDVDMRVATYDKVVKFTQGIIISNGDPPLLVWVSSFSFPRPFGSPIIKVAVDDDNVCS